jgi:hypothetical protein
MDDLSKPTGEPAGGFRASPRASSKLSRLIVSPRKPPGRVPACAQSKGDGVAGEIDWPVRAYGYNFRCVAISARRPAARRRSAGVPGGRMMETCRQEPLCPPAGNGGGRPAGGPCGMGRAMPPGNLPMGGGRALAASMFEAIRAPSLPAPTRLTENCCFERRMRFAPSTRGHQKSQNYAAKSHTIADVTAVMTYLGYMDEARSGRDVASRGSQRVSEATCAKS